MKNFSELNNRLLKNNMEPIYQMKELDEVLKNYTPREIVLKTKSNFNLNHDFFEFDGYGNLESYEIVEDVLEKYIDVE